MSHVPFLHVLREYEIGAALPYLRSSETTEPVKMLEIGAGTGYQAKLLTEHGFEVTAIDTANSAYREDRVYPVTEYDGARLPFASNTFDTIFSSNVLEHVRDVGPLLDEMRRVLKRNGRVVHILPTPVWRFWTILTHYIWLTKRLYQFLLQPFRETGSASNLASPRIPSTWRERIGIFFPLRHGERGTTVTEIYFYRKRWWVPLFEKHGYRVIATRPAGIFYTGGFTFGATLSLTFREALAKILGSSCRIYILTPAEPTSD